MKEQADIAQKAGCHRHDDTLPLVVAVRGQRSDICWTSMVLLLESVCPKTCWNRVRQTGTCRGKAPPSCYARPFCRLKAPLGLSLFCFAPQTRIVYFFVLGAISNMTVTRIYKPYSNQVMVLFQGKLISGWFNANTINAIAIISIIKPRILDIRFFMQSTSLSNWNC